MIEDDHLGEEPRLKHIIENENRELSLFLRGHLVIEAVLNQLLEVAGGLSHKMIEKLTCSKKIQHASKAEIISPEFTAFLKKVNEIRNRFAHRLGYDLSSNDVQQLIILAGKCQEVDFSDDMHRLPKDTLYEWYGDSGGVLAEMFKHVAMDLSFMVESHGGKFMFDR